MPDISLLQPTVLRGVVEKLTASEDKVMLNRIPKTPWPFPTAMWDVIRGSRNIATPNVPNSEAHIVPKLGISQESAAFVYLREKKVFEPTTIHWIREPGTLAAKNAEAAVLREVNDLNERFDAFAEWMCWQVVQGTLTLDYFDVQASIDYKIPPSHKIASPGTSWASATPQQLRDQITAWKRLIQRDARVPATDAWASELTVNRIVQSFTNTPELLSDRMKDSWYSTGVLPNFLGLNWSTNDSVYETSAGVVTQYLPDDVLIISNPTAGRPMEMFVGPTADDEAPSGFTGKFSKTWKEKDPSARQILLEWHILPVITRPEQFVVVADVAP